MKPETIEAISKFLKDNIENHTKSLKRCVTERDAYMKYVLQPAILRNDKTVVSYRESYEQLVQQVVDAEVKLQESIAIADDFEADSLCEKNTYIDKE